MTINSCDEPLRVTAEAGYVLVEGGCVVSVTLTPPAAMTTSDELMDGAAQAIGQRRVGVRED